MATLILLVLLAVAVVAVIAVSRGRPDAAAAEAPMAGDVPDGDLATDGVEEARARALEPLPSIGEDAALHERVAWAQEMLLELQRRADAWRGGGTADVFAELRSRVQTLSEPADPHADERDALARETVELGLVYDGREYEADMHALARELSAALESAVATHRRAFADALEALPPLGWRRRALDQLDACHAGIGEAAQSAIDAYLTRREQLWTELVAAADRAKLEAVREILEADADAMLPVRAAAAFCVVDDVAADNLERSAGALVLEPPPMGDSPAIEDQLRPIEQVFESLERNSVAWAATNALVLQAAAPDSGDALAQSMLGLAGVPENVALAGNDVLSYLHSGAPHDVGLTVDEFASHAIHNVVPAASADATFPETLLEGVHHALSGVLDAKASLVAQLLARGTFGSAIGAYLKSDVLHSAEFFLAQAGQAPQIHDAAGHLLGAVDLTGSALHGLVGHLPVVTLALSTVHEIRVRRDHDASVGDSVANVAIDVFGVGTGMVAAALAGGALGLHGGPLLFVTVPGAAAGKWVSNVFKKKRLENAMAEFASVREVYDGQFSALVADFSSSVHDTVAAESVEYRRTMGEPPRLQDTAGPEVDALARILSAATARFAERTGALLGSVQGAVPQRELERVRQRLGAAEAARARCDRELDRGHPTAALTSLVDAALPFAPSWQPSKEYRATCVATAETLRDLSARHRQEIARWAAHATERFERSKSAITTTVERAAKTYLAEVRSAAAPVEAAFAAVDRERARLGLATG